ncbi:GNAT family N-acetyltransferase [Streptomyces sp. NPDC057854]|uniref:GNAT family N-acetyltransferase n=1 Tax=unclassified Streptomyces TaxID=2593676 RepID=UPI003678FA39
MVEIRPTTDADLGVFVDTLHAAFGRFPETPGEDGGGVWWSALEMDRNLLAVAPDGRPVGTSGAYSFELTLPGGTIVPVAGVTAVGVLPSHRRQGVLSAMMRHQLTGLKARGEVLSVLLASEAVIYRRFGYGPATSTQRMTVPRHRSAFAALRGVPRDASGPASPDLTAAAPGSVELVRRADAGAVLEEVYDDYRRTQPGALSRPPRWWALGAGQPPVAKAPRHVAVHRGADGSPDGYASYSLDGGTLTVDEIIAADDAVFAALARFALDHDLAEKIVLKHVPPGHPLRYRFADYRAAEVSHDTDWLWVRILDVPAALTARGWLADGELVLDVHDPFLGTSGRHLLTVRDGKADCVPTDRRPDLSLDVSDLGSVYLGGTAPSALVRAGHVRAHHAEAADRADALFRTARPPHCLHWF